MKNTTLVTLSTLLLLAMSSFAQANPRGGSYTNGYDDSTVYESRTTVTHYGNYCPDSSYSHPYDRQSYRSYQPSNVYVEQNIYNYQAPRATHRRTYRRTYRSYNQHPSYNNPRPSYNSRTHGYSTYNNSYRGNAVGNTVIGGAFGAAAGAAIGAAVGNPGQGAALGAAIGGFTGLGRGLLW